MSLTRPILLFAGLLPLAIGLVMLLDWAALAPRMVDTLAWATAALLAAALASRVSRWPLAVSLLAAGLALPAVLFSGLPSIMAAALVALGGLAFGTLIPGMPGHSPLVRWVAGMGLLAATAGWVLPLPVHFASTWAAALLLLAACRRRHVLADLARLSSEMGSACRESPWSSTCFAFVVVVAAGPAWLPTLLQDDLTYHLGPGAQLLASGHATLNVGAQAWAMAPWSTDVLHALATLLAGTDARPPLNVGWLLAASLLVRELGLRLGLAGHQAWLAAMVYASVPLVAVMGLGLQVEGTTAALFAAMALVLLDPAGGNAATLRSLAVLAGFLLGAKSSNGLMLLPFFAWMLWEWRGRIAWPALPGAIGLGAFTGGSSYAFSAWLTGNPVLPLFNDVFRSRWFPTDALPYEKWMAAFGQSNSASSGGWLGDSGIDLPWRLIFHATEYSSVYPGGLGLFWLGLAGGAVLALVDPRLRAPTLASLAAMALMFWMMPLARYILPLSTILIPAVMSALVDGKSRLQNFAVAALVALQLLLQPTGSWVLHAGALRQLALGGPEAVLTRFVPERILGREFQALQMPEARLLFADRPRNYSAELPGKAFGLNWHSAELHATRAYDLDDPLAWANLVQTSGATHLVTRSLPERQGLASFLRQAGARRIASAGRAELYALPRQSTPAEGQTLGGIVRVSASLPSDQPQLAVLEVDLVCRTPGAPIGLHWTYHPRGDGRPSVHSHWVYCGATEETRVRMFATLPGAGRMTLRAASAKAGADIGLSLAGARLETRPDFFAKRELYPQVWTSLCPAGLGWCRAPDVSLQPLP